MKKMLTLIAAALMLAACGTTEGVETGSGNTPSTHYTFMQVLPDGGSVLCVWAASGYAGGLSCDWVGVAR